MMVDSEDNIILYGTTSSDDFPTTPNAFNQSFKGEQDLFITKLAKNGSTLLFSPLGVEFGSFPYPLIGFG